jgi:hypothetical protein
MTRPAHPSTHDETLRERLSAATKAEVIIPCQDRATASLVRSRIWALVKAHKAWGTEDYKLLSGLRTKLVDAFQVKQRRPHLDLDPMLTPFCLILDTKDNAAKAIANAYVITPDSPSIPQIAANLPPRQEPLIDLEGDEDEEFSYEKAMERYKGAY